MRRPTGPVSWFGSCEAGQNSSRFDVLTERNIDGARIRRAAGLEFERAVLFHVGIAHHLERILLFDFGGAFNQIDRTLCRYFDVGIARQIDRIVTFDSVRLTISRDPAFS